MFENNSKNQSWKTVSEFSDLVNLSKASIRRHLKLGHIQAINTKIGKSQQGKSLKLLFYPGAAIDIDNNIDLRSSNHKRFDKQLGVFISCRNYLPDKSKLQDITLRSFASTKEELEIERLKLTNLKRKIELDLLLGNLVRVNEVEQELKNLMVNFRQDLNMIPYKLADRLNLDYDHVLDIAEEEFNIVYQNVEKRFSETSGQ